jgi:hypothetical protein
MGLTISLVLCFCAIRAVSARSRSIMRRPLAPVFHQLNINDAHLIAFSRPILLGRTVCQIQGTQRYIPD